MAYQRVGIVNVKLSHPTIPGFGVYLSIGFDNGVPNGNCTAGPPLYTPDTQYFSGAVTDILLTSDGFIAVFSGTIGTREFVSRVPAELVVEVSQEQVKVDGAYVLPLQTPSSGRITLFDKKTGRVSANAVFGVKS